MTLEKDTDALSEDIAQKPYVRLQQVETDASVECGSDVTDFRAEVTECNP